MCFLSHDHIYLKIIALRNKNTGVFRYQKLEKIYFISPIIMISEGWNAHFFCILIFTFGLCLPTLTRKNPWFGLGKMKIDSFYLNQWFLFATFLLKNRSSSLIMWYLDLTLPFTFVWYTSMRSGFEEEILLLFAIYDVKLYQKVLFVCYLVLLFQLKHQAFKDIKRICVVYISFRLHTMLVFTNLNDMFRWYCYISERM